MTTNNESNSAFYGRQYGSCNKKLR